MKPQFWMPAFLAASLAAGFGGAAIFQSFQPVEEPTVVQPALPTYWHAAQQPASPGAMPDFALPAARAIPSVVYIKTEAGQEQSNYFDMFFGNPTGKQVSSGSGVIFSSNGYVVTNNHVVDNAETIEVVHQKRSYPAKLIGTDPSTDLALLKIEAGALPAVRIGDSRKIQVGQWVLAVGNPFNLTSTVTAGIISAKGRNINLLSGQFPIESFIQTDAAINPGNSGGALVNSQGELVGINTAIFSRTGSYTGYGFAVPSDIVKKVVEDLIKYGTVQKGFFGADVVEVDGGLAKKLDLPNIDGVAITELQEEGPADKAGLKKNDVILKINNQAINGKGMFDEEVAFYNPGDKINIQYRRSGKVGTALLTLTNREGTTELLRRTIFSSRTVGADLETVSKVERDKYQIQSGVRVVKAYANGLIRRLNLEEGTIIVSINRQPIEEPAQVEQYLQNLKGRLVLDVIDKNGQRGFYQFGY